MQLMEEPMELGYTKIALATPNAFTLKDRATFIVSLLVFLGLLNWYAPANPTLAERLLASAIIALCAFPTWRWMSGSDRGIPFMPFYGMVFALYFAIPLFLIQDYGTNWSPVRIPHRFVLRALAFILAGLASLMIGYYGPQNLAIQPILPRFRMEWRRPGNLKLWGIIFGVLGLAIFAFAAKLKLPAELLQLVTFGADFCIVGVCILFALQLTGRLDRITAIFLWCILVPARFVLGLSTGLTSQALILALALLFLYSTVRRRMPWRLFLVCALGFFVLRPAEGMLRMTTWRGGAMDHASQVQKGKMLGNLVWNEAKQSIRGQSEFSNAVVRYSARRLGIDILTFADVIHDTPSIIPYWHGATYYPLLFKFIPRFLYPEKPEEVTGQTFGHRYGLLWVGNNSTSYNMPQLIELYANFGAVGVIVGMFLFGMLFRSLQSMLVHPTMGFGALIAAVFVSVGLFQMESAASLVLGSIIWAFIYMGVLNLLVQAGELEPEMPSGRYAPVR